MTYTQIPTNTQTIPFFLYNIFQPKISIHLHDLKVSSCFHHGCINPSFHPLLLTYFWQIFLLCVLSLRINLHEKQMFPFFKEKRLFEGQWLERRTSTGNKRQWQVPLSLLLLRCFSHDFNFTSSFPKVIEGNFDTSTGFRFINWAIPKIVKIILLNKSNPCVHS